MAGCKKWLIGLGILLFAIAVVLILRQPRRPRVVFDLPDGTKMEVRRVTYGHVLHFYEGELWQQVLFTICRTNIPVRFRGTEVAFKSRNTEGSLGVELRHYSTNGVQITPIGGRGRLMLVESLGKEWYGLSSTHFSAKRVNGVVGVVTEDLYCEFPLSPEKELRFRFYAPNALNETLTNEFTIPNPAL